MRAARKPSRSAGSPLPQVGRAAIYVRVSTGAQVDGTSIDGQLSQCRAEADRRGWIVAGEYVDAGVSGAKDSRPALDELLAAASSGELDVVLIAKLDRLGRSLLHLLTLMQQFDALGVRVVSASDNIDTRTPAGRMMVQLLGVFAEFERERIRERSREGARVRVEDGGFVSSTPPFGYRAHPDPRGKRGVVLNIDPAQAACIREMHRLLVSERMPVSMAARKLNGAGHRSASGAEWTPETLARWARGDSPSTAAGTWRWNDLAVDIPAILTRVQATEWATWKAETTTATQIDHGAYLLGGIVMTPCGRRYHGRTAGNQAPVYACRHRLTTKAGDPRRCDCVSIRVEALDSAVWSEVAAALTNQTALEALAHEAAAVGQPDIGGDTLGGRIADAARAVADLQQRIADEYQAARDDGFDAAMARLMVQPLHRELKATQAEQSRLGKARVALMRVAGNAALLRETLKRVRGTIEDLDVRGKQDVLSALAVEVRVAGYEPCAACGGSGYQPIPPDSGRRWPPACDHCQRMRVLPVVEVRLTAPEALLELANGRTAVAG